MDRIIKKNNFLISLFIIIIFLMILILLFALLPSRISSSNFKINNIPAFFNSDKVLILAPHPDDEAIATAGVIQKALKAGSDIKVVFFTNGDFNSTSFPFIKYKTKTVTREQKFLMLGKI